MESQVRSDNSREFRVKREIAIRWLTLIAASAIVAITLMLQAPVDARADAPPARAKSIDSNTYKGWGVVQIGAASADAWKWSAQGWDKTTVPVGASIWLHPWGDGWYWVWRNDSWYAMQTSVLARWQCGEGDIDVSKAGGAVQLHRYNTDRSASLGSVTGAVTAVCYNPFPDAGVNKDRRYVIGSEGYMLVRGTINGAAVTGYADECDLEFVGRHPRCN